MRYSRPNPTSRLRTNSVNRHRQSDSAQSCKDALDSNAPLLLSAMLIQQMRQDIKSNRGKYFHRSLDICSRSSDQALIKTETRSLSRPHPKLFWEHHLCYHFHKFQWKLFVPFFSSSSSLL